MGPTLASEAIAIPSLSTFHGGDTSKPLDLQVETTALVCRAIVSSLDREYCRSGFDRAEDGDRALVQCATNKERHDSASATLTQDRRVDRFGQREPPLGIQPAFERTRGHVRISEQRGDALDRIDEGLSGIL
jgi:hypothetical protein